MTSFAQWWMHYRMGYLPNQMGIMRRYLDHKEEWENHLQRSKQLIIAEVNKRKPKSIAFLGSGWLLDIPLANILEQGITVTLIDIAHPKRIIHKYRNCKNVSLVHADITGGAISWAWSLAKQRGSRFELGHLLSSSEMAIHELTRDYDFAVSVNTLSQLHVHIEEFLSRRDKISENERIQLAHALQQGHINGLPFNKSLIISDIEAEFYSEDGELSHTSPRVYTDIAMLTQVNQWKWYFDNNHSFNPEYKVVHSVAAYLK
jgi:hypothetical protein